MKRSVITTANKFWHWFYSSRTELQSLDTETTSLDYMDQELVGISLCDGEQACYIDLLNLDNRDELLESLRVHIPRIQKLIYWNAPFDMKVLYKYGIEHTTDIIDAQVAAHLLNEEGTKKLKDLAEQYLGVQTTRFEEAAAGGYQTDDFYRYAVNDAVYTFRLWELFQPELERQELASLFFDVEMPFQVVLRDMEINGVLIDQTTLISEREHLRKDIKRLEQAVYDAGGVAYTTNFNLLGEAEFECDLNLNSSIQLSEFVRNELGIKLTQRTDSGHYTLDKKVLEGLAGTHKFCSSLLEYRAASKLLSSFLEKLPNHIDCDGRIRSSFNNTVTVTGRLSSSDPNMQQLPKGSTIRRCLVAPEGYTYLCADYSGQELRVLAEVSRDITMIDAFLKGQDLHLSMANQFFSLGIPDAYLFTDHPKHDEIKAKFKKERDKAKILNFGLAYGKGSYGFAKDWNVTEAEATEIIDAYFAAYPRIKDAIDRCNRQVEDYGYVVNLAGRRRRFSVVNNRAKRQAFNFLIQGFSADLVKKAAGKVYQLCQQCPEWDVRTVLQVHDELVWEVKEDYIEEVLPQVKYVMEHCWNLCVPMPVDIHAGKDYGSVK